MAYLGGIPPIWVSVRTRGTESYVSKENGHSDLFYFYCFYNGQCVVAGGERRGQTRPLTRGTLQKNDLVKLNTTQYREWDRTVDIT